MLLILLSHEALVAFFSLQLASALCVETTLTRKRVPHLAVRYLVRIHQRCRQVWRLILHILVRCHNGRYAAPLTIEIIVVATFKLVLARFDKVIIGHSMRLIEERHVEVHGRIVHWQFRFPYALQVWLAATLLGYLFVDTVPFDEVPLVLRRLHYVWLVAAFGAVDLAFDWDWLLLVNWRLLRNRTWHLQISYAVLLQVIKIINHISLTLAFELLPHQLFPQLRLLRILVVEDKLFLFVQEVHLLNPVRKVIAEEAIKRALSLLKVHLQCAMLVPEIFVFDPAVACLREIALLIMLVVYIFEFNQIQVRPDLYVALVNVQQVQITIWLRFFILGIVVLTHLAQSPLELVLTKLVKFYVGLLRLLI